jgi:hypothetical protein
VATLADAAHYLEAMFLLGPQTSDIRSALFYLTRKAIRSGAI